MAYADGHMEHFRGWLEHIDQLVHEGNPEYQLEEECDHPEFVMFHMIRLHFLSGNVEGFQDVVTRFSHQPADLIYWECRLRLVREMAHKIEYTS